MNSPWTNNCRLPEDGEIMKLEDGITHTGEVKRNFYKLRKKEE